MKYSVQIADFDFVELTREPRHANQLTVVKENLVDVNKIKGTLEYRPPEVSVQVC